MKIHHKYLVLVSLALIFSLLTLNNKMNINAQEPQGKNWMSFIGDQRPLQFISIPGTHDSGALHNLSIKDIFTNKDIVLTYAQTQNKTIVEQLEMGVRYLDIRCRFNNGKFEIYHGSVSQKQSFDDVIKACQKFLKENPSETIIMNIKEENSKTTNNTFSQRFVQYYYSYPNLFEIGNHIPKLGEVRGKIVVIRRFVSGDNIGIDAQSFWKDNTTFIAENKNGVQFYIQDNYKFNKNELKFDNFKKALEESGKEIKMNRGSRKLHLNFTSGQLDGASGSKIKAVSDYINPKLVSLFSQTQYQNSFNGIIITDFVNEDIARIIYETNF